MDTSSLEKAFENWARTKDIVTAFGDALEMLVCEFTPHWIDPDTGHPAGRYTDKYLEVVRRYEPDHVREYYPPICKAVFATYDQGVTPDGGWCDPLGDFFQEIASNRDKSWKGQFFTPGPVCDMMARLTLQENEQRPELNILDPACGSGRMQIAFDRACQPGSNNTYVGVDIDPRCIRIAAINFFFHGMMGTVICGNSLTMETRFGYRIRHPLTGLGIEHLNADECLPYLLHAQKAQENPEAKTRSHPEAPGSQLTLF